MKKNILLFLLALVIIPIKALADTGGPDIREYDAIVINPNGANVYDWKNDKYEVVGSLNYNDVVTVRDELEINDVPGVLIDYGTNKYGDPDSGYLLVRTLLQ